jgi:hypothetical protein
MHRNVRVVAQTREGFSPRCGHETAVDRSEILAGYRRVRGFSWPRRFPLVQFPNDALITAFLAGQFAAILHGAGSADARALSYIATTIWAYEELAHGVNWFRHLLGLVYVLSTVVHLARALGH